MNLEAGRFRKPFALEGASDADGGEGGTGFGGGEDIVTGVNAIDINPAHQLLSFGTETDLGRGTVEMWDPRSRSRAALLRLPYAKLLAASGSSASLLSANLPGLEDVAVGRRGVAVTALASKSDGLNLAVGTSTGHVLLYDLRANRPYTTKDQGYGMPIKKVEWIDSGVATGEVEAEGGWVASADEKVVKIWGKETVSKNAAPFFFLEIINFFFSKGDEPRRDQPSDADQRHARLPGNRPRLPRQRNLTHVGLLHSPARPGTQVVPLPRQHDGGDGGWPGGAPV